MKIMQYTSNTNLDEQEMVIDQSLIKTIETETDNKETEKSLISEDETVLGFWEKSDWDNIND